MDRAWTQPENFTIDEAKAEEARIVVVQIKEEYINGTLSAEHIEDLKRMIPPYAFQAWTRQKEFRATSLVNQKVKTNKLKQRIKDLLCARMRKYKWKKCDRKFTRIKRDFFKIVGTGESGFEELVNKVCIENGLQKMFKS